MEKLTELETRVIALEQAVALLMRISPHADLLLQGQEQLSAELSAQGVPESCFKLLNALRTVHLATGGAEAAPRFPE